MHEIVIGSVDGIPVVYENQHADMAILSVIGKLLAGTLVAFGLKALKKLIESDEFKAKYPGGKLKLLYKIVKDVCEDDYVQNKIIPADKFEEAFA